MQLADNKVRHASNKDTAKHSQMLPLRKFMYTLLVGYLERLVSVTFMVEMGRVEMHVV